nr:beta-2 adrenergic receptor isoform X1 [Hydra vulgaris]
MLVMKKINLNICQINCFLEMNNNSDSPSLYTSLSPDVTIALAGCFISISILGITFNAILILIILVNKNLHTVVNIFIVNLAIADIITAVTVVPFDADYMLKGYFPYGTFLCAFKETMFLLSLPSSVVNLLLLTFERFTFAVFPFKNACYFTKKNTLIMIIAGWIYTVMAALFPIFYNGTSSIKVTNKLCYLSFPRTYAFYQIFVNFTIPVVIMAALNTILFAIVHKYKKSVQKNFEFNISNSIENSVNNGKPILMLVGIFMFCWLTFIALASSNLMCSGCHPRVLTWFGNVINYTSIVLNPLVYGLFNKSIRKVFMQKINKTYTRINKTNSKCFQENSESKADTLL